MSSSLHVCDLSVLAAAVAMIDLPSWEAFADRVLRNGEQNVLYTDRVYIPAKLEEEQNVSE